MRGAFADFTWNDPINKSDVGIVNEFVGVGKVENVRVGRVRLMRRMGILSMVIKV